MLRVFTLQYNNYGQDCRDFKVVREFTKFLSIFSNFKDHWTWRNSWVAVLYNHLVAYPNYLNSMYFWTFGFVGTLFFGIQLISGILLSMQYTAYSILSFDVVEHIMRDVNFGWLLRYLHANGASFFFFVIYLHIMRGLFFSSYSNSRGLLWLSGILIFILMMAIAFLGYILPWGQMSFWGATVITNLFSAIPFIGDSIAFWLWGGFSVDNATLVRFFSLHYLLPFVLLGLIFVHFFLLHIKGSTNPCGTDANPDIVSLYPNFIYKDFLSILFFAILYLFFVFYNPNFLGHSDNYIPANPLVTPAHIVPEWYFLPFYAILRAIPSKLGGVIVMGGALIVLLLLPFLTTSYIRTTRFRPLQLFLCFCFAFNFLLLGWLGGQPVTVLFILLGRLCAYFYFFILFVILPLLWVFEYCSVLYFHVNRISFLFWFKRKWEMSQLRLLKYRLDFFYLNGILLLFLFFGIFSFYFFTVSSINVFFRKRIYFWSPRIILIILFFFVILLNCWYFTGTFLMSGVFLYKCYSRAKQKFCDCRASRNCSMVDVSKDGNKGDKVVPADTVTKNVGASTDTVTENVGTATDTVAKDGSAVVDTLMKDGVAVIDSAKDNSKASVIAVTEEIVFLDKWILDFYWYTLCEIVFVLIFLIFFRRFLFGQLFLLFLQRKTLYAIKNKVFSNAFFLKFSYKQLFLGCVDEKIHSEVMVDSNGKNFWAGIFVFIRFWFYALLLGYVFVFFMACYEHIAVLGFFIHTHMHSIFFIILLLLLLVSMFIAEREFQRTFADSNIDVAISLCIISLLCINLLLGLQIVVVMLLFGVLNFCLIVSTAAYSSKAHVHSIAKLVILESFALCVSFFSFFYLYSTKNFKRSRVDELTAARTNNLFQVELPSEIYARLLADSKTFKSFPVIPSASTNASTFSSEKASVAVDVVSSVSISDLSFYNLHVYFSGLSAGEALLGYSAILLPFVVALGFLFIHLLYKNIIVTSPYFVFVIFNLFKLIAMYFVLLVAESMQITFPHLCWYFLVMFFISALVALVIAILNASNIRFSIFSIFLSSGFFISSLFFTAFSQKMLLLIMYSIFVLCVLSMIVHIASFHEYYEGKIIVFYSELFHVMSKLSFIGIRYFLLGLCSLLSFPLFFSFYYKACAVDYAMKMLPLSSMPLLIFFVVFYTVLNVIVFLRIFHFLISSQKDKGYSIIFSALREDFRNKSGVIFSISYFHTFLPLFLFFIFFVSGAFFMEILVEIPRFGEAYSMRRVFTIYATLEQNGVFIKSNGRAVLIEPYSWRNVTWDGKTHRLVCVLSEKDLVQLKKCQNTMDILVFLQKRFGSEYMEKLLNSLREDLAALEVQEQLKAKKK